MPREDTRVQLEDEFGDIVSKARIGNGLSASQLADRSGLSERDVSEIESYRLTPGPNDIRSLAETLSLDPSKLEIIAKVAWTPSQPDLSHEPFVLQTIPVPFGSYTENSYILGCRETKLAAVIDPGGAVNWITHALTTHGLRLHCVLVTHAHRDHIGGLSALVETVSGVTVISSRIDRNALTTGLNAEWKAAEDAESFALGKLTITAASTPGHTPGSTCYITQGACFVGDTLFAGSIGRPAGQSVYRKMLDAIESKVLSQPPDTALLPGHGPLTTVAEEQLHNPFF